jgi:hypothetical protein
MIIALSDCAARRFFYKPRVGARRAFNLTYGRNKLYITPPGELSTEEKQEVQEASIIGAVTTTAVAAGVTSILPLVLDALRNAADIMNEIRTAAAAKDDGERSTQQLHRMRDGQLKSPTTRLGVDSASNFNVIGGSQDGTGMQAAQYKIRSSSGTPVRLILECTRTGRDESIGKSWNRCWYAIARHSSII